MNLLTVGLSHRSAPVRVLERVAIGADEVGKVLDELLGRPHISEAFLVSTCNRVEVYAVAETFHGGLNDVTEVLARKAGAEVAELADHFYVHYAGAAVEHLFSVAAGLDSMVVGEAQILGQLRQAYGVADQAGTVGRTLHELAQQALRVGKRVHAETEIDAAGASVVSEALSDAEALLGGVAGKRALLVGAGSMGGLAAAQLRRAGIGSVVIANRTAANGARLAESLRAEGIPADAVELAGLGSAIAAADLVVTCTGAVGAVITEDVVADAVRDRDDSGQPLLFCDLGLPRDTAPEVAELPGVAVVDLETLQARLTAQRGGSESDRAAAIVADELRGYLASQRSAEVTPTVTALRKRAAEVVDSELLRLDSRLPELDGPVRDELSRTVRRVVDKLLHAPTVRVKELASVPGGSGYAEALRELFELDPQAPTAIRTPRSAEDVPVTGAHSAQALLRDPLAQDGAEQDGEDR
ncbi:MULTISPECIES: glutamyl-tRNA reductase [Saccharopolyspora]|uniref:glutamyl-tRNA reductase n=1 Tax=Saccharopolyspora TaxID=1835 RepID=UPI001CD58DC1|nr:MULTISPECIES: glutamyl-tRNA reductase [Saccharopolyspora]MCA1189605.1 glutamyl-tRNA reductase [Saccharopolyspora sp. 6T]MCA1191013.1 glutamyl-tRNA reductase [Saccharopolyspora sp. 6V]MCA1226006.1 glutamyl-tRNA reductase [Saccharopolyspora sp. 6M]MCA1278725.1 glutamyl-tRNA reductase [Saccharopolyspora sp. 7B]